RALQLPAPAQSELFRAEECAQGGADIAVSVKEGVREAVDERVGNRPFVRREAPAQLVSDEARRGGLAGEALEASLAVLQAQAGGRARSLPRACRRITASSSAVLKKALSPLSWLMLKWSLQKSTITS